MANKNWTFNEALAANEAALVETPGRSASDPTLPLFQWFALCQLEGYGKAFENDSYCLMTAIRTCANHDLPLPEWASKAYIKAYDTVNTAREKSWDTVFGNPYPKGRHLKAIRKKIMLKFAVLNEVTTILAMKPDTPIDDGLFETVAEELNKKKTLAGEKFKIEKTLVGEYYYAAKNQIERGNFQSIHISADSIEIVHTQKD